ncbi:MAG: branched-chain amino acid ABC transporter permease [Xanthobacteraceae bacterium]|nr:branched-chain amino acid ABC transporter permease [Xanthobacteraceae bacterium]
MQSAGLLSEALVSGVLVGGFYAAMAVGISIAFGMLGISNIAHPAIILLGSFIVYVFNTQLGVDPLVAGVLLTIPFYFLGTVLYSGYEIAFERRGAELIRGLSFFFGLFFITEVGLQLMFGVDYRLVQASYIGPTFNMGPVSLPLRMLIPFLVSLAMLACLQVFFMKTFTGRAIMAVAQDKLALQLMGASPTKIKRVAFGISIASAALAGALLIILQPVEPSVGRDLIGRIFAICVLGGVGSLPGTFVAAIIIGVIESITSTFYGPSWSPAVAFGMLLVALVVRPVGIFGRA